MTNEENAAQIPEFQKVRIIQVKCSVIVLASVWNKDLTSVSLKYTFILFFWNWKNYYYMCLKKIKTKKLL